MNDGVPIGQVAQIPIGEGRTFERPAHRGVPHAFRRGVRDPGRMSPFAGAASRRIDRRRDGRLPPSRAHVRFAHGARIKR
jgi:hypothetical protein